jgi:UDP-N-acetylmuramate dehydrogenase
VAAAREGWAGLEFAVGIPGSVGGAVVMNAGADGGETADTLVSVEVVNVDGTSATLAASDLRFGYRRSPFQQGQGAPAAGRAAGGAAEQGRQGEQQAAAAVVAATFRLRRDATAERRARALLARRKASQPWGARTAGRALASSPLQRPVDRNWSSVSRPGPLSPRSLPSIPPPQT